MFYPTLKVVSSNCNLRCVYCYYKGIHRKKPIRMNDITLKSIIQKLLALSGEEKEVHFYWHGGEPLLAGIDFYQKIILLENELNVYGKKICNHIQTNATLLTDNWVDFLVGNDFNVGISLDGPKEIQDVNRPTISGGGSFDSVMKGLKLFQEREKFPSIISVVTNESLGNANKIFDFFVENKIKRFLPKDCCERDETGKFLPFSTTPDEYVDFLIELFECWMSKNDPTIEIRNLYQIIRGVVGGKTTLCEYSGRCHLFLTIEYDGTIGGCDSFPVKNYPMGNINDSAVSSIFGSHGYKSFLRDMESTRLDCHHCEWFGNVCGGGCLGHSYSEQNSAWGKNIFCTPKKRLFEYIKRRVSEIQNN